MTIKEQSLNNLFISVIIPMYNRSKTIIECLDSVCAQTFKNIEIIVVDDFSTDNSVDLVSSYQDNRIKLIKLEKNSGAQVARNRGIIEAKREWIAFNDSDDLWEKDKLEIQTKELEKINFNKDTVIHSNCTCLDLINNKTWEWKVPKTYGLCYKLLLERPAPLFPTILTSKKALLEIGLLDENVPSYQEWDTSIRLAKKCKFIHIEKPLFTYIFHDGETISKNNKRDIEGYLYIINKFKKELQEYNFYEKHINQLSKRANSFSLFQEAEEILKMI